MRNSIIIIGLNIILLTTLAFTIHTKLDKDSEELHKACEEIMEQSDTVELKALNTLNLLEELQKNKVKHPEIVLRQSIMESGWFKCTSCSMRYNNPFGFRHTSWVDKENPSGYLKFDKWQDAVKYYKKWQKKRYKGGDYYEFLINIGYAEDPKYISKLKSLNI